MDLLTARLTATPGFELVERAALDAILRELSLMASSLSKTEEAVRVGRMTKADWFLLVSFPQGTTNLVVGKVVDASTGVIRDLEVLPIELANPAAGVEALAQFMANSRKAPARQSRLWIGFGGFEDLGLYARYPNFGDQLRLDMSLKYAGSRVSVTERSQVAPLLEEQQLSGAGLTGDSSQHSEAQPAFVLVDGVYQAFQDEQSKINLALRMEWVGGRTHAVMIKELPGRPLEAKVGEAIDRFLAASPAPTSSTRPPHRWHPTRSPARTTWSTARSCVVRTRPARRPPPCRCPAQRRPLLLKSVRRRRRSRVPTASSAG